MAQDSQEPGQRIARFTSASLADLAAIHAYNAQAYGDGHAQRFMGFLKSEVMVCAAMPGLGRPVPEFQGLRIHIAKSSGRRSAHGYRIIYQESLDGIEVIRVLHTRVNWRAQIDQGSD